MNITRYIKEYWDEITSISNRSMSLIENNKKLIRLSSSINNIKNKTTKNQKQMKPKSQKDAIRKHLNAGKSLSPMDALKFYGCFRLAAVVDTLKKEGMKIVTLRQKFISKYGFTGAYAVYKKK